jgi:hypothetical protein
MLQLKYRFQLCSGLDENIGNRTGAKRQNYQEELGWR